MKSNNNLRQYLAIALGIILIATLASLFFVIFENQKELSDVFVKLQMSNSFDSNFDSNKEKKQEIKVIEKVVSQQPWGAVQNMAKDTVVQIIAQTAEINFLKPYETPRQGGGYGSGFFISDTGEIITNMHVIDQAQSVWIKIPSLGKAIIDVEIVGKSPERDLALLRVTPEGMEIIKNSLTKIPSLNLGDSDLVNRADEVLALGYPLGQASLKSTSGVVSGREHIGGRYLIQISSPINPGSSGGPALNLNGEVVGITCAGILAAQNIGYIIPVNELKLILNDLRTKKLLRKPFLGVLVSNGSEDLACYLGNPVPSGCYVVDVYPNGPLYKAGVLAGDMIYEINKMKIDEFGDLCVPWSEEKLSFVDYISRWEEGEKIQMVIYRKGKRKEITFEFGHTDLSPIKKIIVGEDPLDYEIFGGMLLQPLTLNLVQALISNAPALVKYAEFKHQTEPALIVTHIVPGSQVDRLVCIREGSIISELDGKPIKTMDELRAGLRKAIKQDRIVFKTVDGVLFVLNTRKACAEEEKFSKIYHYPLSPFVQELRNTAFKRFKDDKKTVG